jgi:transposase
LGQRVEITAKERRRRWRDDERRHVVAEAFAPGAIASYVARRYGVAESYPFAWRKRFSGSPNGAPPDGPRLIPVMVDPASSDPAPIPPLSRHATITWPDGIRLEVPAGYPATALKR